ncbi:MAG: dihydroneopterin aldolase [Pseudomonadota bacterium]
MSGLEPLSFDEITGDPEISDQIFLSAYVREIEIGAYEEEFGVTQKVQFDIAVEVTRNTAHLDDQVSRVINYDDLIAAITALIEGPRISLLETFAEQLATRLLANPLALKAKIRIEKIDRLPGDAGLGIEIVRQRSD